MRRGRSRWAGSLLALALLLGLLPGTVWAAGTQEITVRFSAQAAGSFLCAPQEQAKVSANLAESYGYQDEVDGVSALDVLVRAH